MQLLVKANRNATSLRLSAGPAIALRPLMPSVDGAARLGVGATIAPAWHLTEAIDPGGCPWDSCHALLRDGLGIGAGGEVALAEPDLEQPWLKPAPGGLGIAGQTAAAPQSQDYPRGPGDDWFRRPKFAALAIARGRVALPEDPAQRIRIAHLDTGYDPAHGQKPHGLLEAAGLNFADPNPDGAPTQGAQDRRTAEVNPMFGHGAATLALLAGPRYGGASGFEVLPLRVANWVVLFRNSAIAAAFDHVHRLAGDPARRCQVLSMSMGGLASAAWADAVNALYEAGVVLVTAAGNNYGNLPVRSIVYPARFGRVLAACGVMADGVPYADLSINHMAGCYGPTPKMRTALSAWTPNTPWARFGAAGIVDQNGGGTSSATPQIAAAAALWLQHHAAALAGYAGWERVEAVRDALFRAATRRGTEPDEHLGRGVLQADAALDIAPAPRERLRRQPEDATDFALLRLLSGLGVQPSAAERMLELEALQLSQSRPQVAAALGTIDPGAPADVSGATWRQVLQALADNGASVALKRRVGALLGSGAVAATKPDAAALRRVLEQPVTPPTHRRLRVFAFDPSFASRMATRGIATATLQVPWEKDLEPGPRGEYLEVVDIDHAAGRAYAPVDLNRPEILAQDGLEPSEGSPQFHQQMTYAVAMKTIEHFRVALGRVPFWADRSTKGADGKWSSRFVRRLRIYPHALRDANAFYSPDKAALLFGYFRAAAPGSAEVLRGGMVFSGLSHDIVAHETTHALLDGLHRRWKEPTNPDALAFHEAFADIVALFQHFTLPDALLAEIRRTRGRMQFATMLGNLARQFGQAVGGHGALRAAIGRKSHPTDYADARSKGPHQLGEVLVAAIFDAWLQVYADRTADLFRLASGGTGVLPQGEIPHDLARRLAEEAAKLAGHFLNICIRALDYCPPVDPTFGEYLRGLITADRDLVKDDPLGYRVALVDGFRNRGILPEGVQTWSPDALVWERPEVDLAVLATVIGNMAGGWQLNSDRLAAWRASRRDAGTLQPRLNDPNYAGLLPVFGLWPEGAAVTIDGIAGTTSPLEVHSVRPARRVGPDGQVVSDVVIEVTQKWQWQDRNADAAPEFIRGGCTVIWDRTAGCIRYVIRKQVAHPGRTREQLAFRLAATESGAAASNYYETKRRRGEPFALLHADL